MEIDMTKGRPFNVIVRFAIPIIIGNFFQFLYSIADSVIVGKLMGTEALAAVGSTTVIIYAVQNFIMGITNGFGIRLGHAFGGKDYSAMRKSAAASIVLSVIFSAVITFACCFFTNGILSLMNVSTELYSLTYDYLFIVFLGSGATFFYNMAASIMRALGNSKLPLICLLLSSILNIVLDLIFMIPLDMGVAGAALAFVAAQLASAILCIIAALKNFTVLRLTSSDFADIGSEMKTQLGVCVPMGLQMSVMCIGSIAIQSLVNSIGTAAVAGYAAASKVDRISSYVNDAMISAVYSYMSQNFGARRLDRIKEGLRVSLFQIELISMVLSVIILLLKHPIVYMFLSSPSAEIIHYSDIYITYTVPFYFLMGLLSVYRPTIQSMNNTAVPFLACMTELATRLAVSILLPQFIGYLSVGIASPIAWSFASAILIPVYYRTVHIAGNSKRALR